jgi:mono/diheme cytochrome c family protein
VMAPFSRKINLLTLLVAGAFAPALQAQSDAADPRLSAMVDRYCVDCHNFEDWAGSLDFDTITADPIHGNADVWEKTLRKLRGRLMPPPGNEQPPQEEIDAFVAWMENTLDDNADMPRAGHVPLQRLNRYEYSQSVKALLDVDIDATEFLPADIEMDGFDNIAAALSVSPAFTDQFVTLARKAAALAVGGVVPKLSNTYYPPLGAATQGGYIAGFPLGSRGGMKFEHLFPTDGEYRLNVLDLGVGLNPRGMETEHTLVVLVDGEEVFRQEMGGLEDLMSVSILGPGAAGTQHIMQRVTDIPLQVTAGKHEVVLTFIERARSLSTSWATGGFGGGGFGSRFADGVQIVGPFNPVGVSMTSSRERIFVCQPQAASEERACAARIATDLAQRAFRRPVDAAEVERLLQFYDQGRTLAGGFDSGVEHLVAAILVSPDFMYRALSPAPDSGNDAEVYALGDLELASRLSYFLWSQPPDEELLHAAIDGDLKRDRVMNAQIERMLADPRAQALVNSFALKWLNLDDLDAVQPDPAIFRQFNPVLRADIEEELQRFLASVLLEDQPVTALLDANWTFLNENLARHYGIPGVLGPQFRRVELTDERRFGLLGKGAVLLRTSYGDRTSPVLRGAWVLEKLMGTPPSPPPPNVETDLSVPEGEQVTTVRARLEQHRDNPSCNQCHGVIDPIGLALENFTVLGQWRDRDVDANVAIDASTIMPNGAAINGPVELRAELGKRPAMFAQAITEKLMMYAVNRELEYFDMPQVRAIVADAEDDDYRLSALVRGIVNSDAFRLQAKPHETGIGSTAQAAGAAVHPELDQQLASKE